MNPEPRYPYVHVDVTPEMVDETSGLLFELGAEGVEERDDGTLAKAAASGKVTLVAAFPSRDSVDRDTHELGELLLRAADGTSAGRQIGGPPQRPAVRGSRPRTTLPLRT